MRMRVRTWTLLGVAWNCIAMDAAPPKPPNTCARAVLQAEVADGNAYEANFAPGLLFLLEPIASGWIVRVLPMAEKRGAHNFAELATPPYDAVTPLAIGTDFSFRAQDAVGWNPRRFHYIPNAATFRKMSVLYDPAMRGQGTAASELASLSAAQPEAQLTILDAHLVPGSNDQAQMAAAVASHFATTPHTIDQSGGSSPLGRVTWMKFKVGFDLPAGMHAMPGVMEESRNCDARPTKPDANASHLSHAADKL